MERIIVQMDESTLAELDEAAEEASLSRSALVRRCIESTLAERRRRRELQDVVESFQRRPQENGLIAPKAARRRAWPA